jgi:DmsE family decaheme c-type cytochrome
MTYVKPRLANLAGAAVLLTALLAAGVAWSQASPYPDGYTGEGAEKVGSETCLMCHADQVPASTFTHLALLDLNQESPYYGYGCEGCHGPGGNHMGDPAGILDPVKLNADQVTDLCSKCHETLRSYDLEGWRLSTHRSADLGCLSCHGGHSSNDKFLVKESKLDLCYMCHLEKRAEFNMRSHHPVEEGQISCDDCHNPMSGMFDGQLKADGDELCFQCHPDKEGPFTFDHPVDMAAGGNGCLTCHFVHGSNTDNLVRFPHRLCLECHSDRTAANHYPGTCWSTGCHVQIHGSYSSELFFH